MPSQWLPDDMAVSPKDSLYAVRYGPSGPISANTDYTISIGEDYPFGFLVPDRSVVTNISAVAAVVSRRCAVGDSVFSPVSRALQQGCDLALCPHGSGILDEGPTVNHDRILILRSVFASGSSSRHHHDEP